MKIYIQLDIPRFYQTLGFGATANKLLYVIQFLLDSSMKVIYYLLFLAYKLMIIKETTFLPSTASSLNNAVLTRKLLMSIGFYITTKDQLLCISQQYNVTFRVAGCVCVCVCVCVRARARVRVCVSRS
jgi:hypothetical protein